MGSTFHITWEHQRSSPKNHHVMSRSNRIISCKSCHIISCLPSALGISDWIHSAASRPLWGRTCGKAARPGSSNMFQDVSKNITPTPSGGLRGWWLEKKNAAMIWWFAFDLLKVSFPFLLISQHQSTWIWYDVWFDLVKSYLSFHELLSS